MNELPGDPSLPPGVTIQMIDPIDNSQTCSGCEGECRLSSCCHAPFSHPGFPDTDVCSTCLQPAEPVKCQDCHGTGEEPRPKPDFDDQDD
jgi:hypothetical protein